MAKKQEEAPIYYRGVRYDKHASKGLKAFADVVDQVFIMQTAGDGRLGPAKDAIYAFRALDALKFEWEWTEDGNLMIECYNGETCTVSTVKELRIFIAGAKAERGEA
jgi:hypothetical protein